MLPSILLDPKVEIISAWGVCHTTLYDDGPVLFIDVLVCGKDGFRIVSIHPNDQTDVMKALANPSESLNIAMTGAIVSAAYHQSKRQSKQQ